MSGWTSVQIVTVVVAALTPLTVAALGYFVARAGQRIGQMQWANQTVVARRLDIFKEVAPQINRVPASRRSWGPGRRSPHGTRSR